MYFVINFREKSHIYSKTQGEKNWNLAMNPAMAYRPCYVNRTLADYFNLIAGGFSSFM